jgi:hypothetical protein
MGAWVLLEGMGRSFMVRAHDTPHRSESQCSGDDRHASPPYPGGHAEHVRGGWQVRARSFDVLPSQVHSGSPAIPTYEEPSMNRYIVRALPAAVALVGDKIGKKIPGTVQNEAVKK